jgi:L-iditol 2-dehydrogenase
MDGAFAAHVVVGSSALHKIAENVTFDEAALGEPLAVGVHAVIECGEIKAGDWVLVTGPGPIGLIVLQIAKSSGAKVIITGTEKDALRLEIAAGMGADQVLRVDKDNLHDVTLDLTDDVGIHTAFECSGTPFALKDCLSSVKKRGQIIQVGLFGRAVECELDQIALKVIKLMGAFAHNHGTWNKAMDLLKNKKIDLKPLISREFPLSDWQEAFRLAEEGKGIKYLLRPID